MTSSILQMTLDHENMIFKEGDPDKEKEKVKKDGFYTIAEKVAFLKKTGDSLKVNMPDGQSILHCSQQHVFSVLTIS